VIESIEVHDDSNSDGVLSPGEKAKIQILLRNGGEGDLVGPDFVLSTDSAYVSVTGGDTGSCGNVLQPEAKRLCGSSTVEVAPNAPPGTNVHFTFLVTDAESSSWTLEFSLPLLATAANPKIETVEVMDDDNDDGVLNPGEKAKLRLLLRNGGASDLMRPDFVLSTDSEYVTVSGGDTGSCGNILQPEAKWWCGSSSVEVAPNVPPGTNVLFVFFVTDDQSNSWPLEFSLPLLATAAKPEIDMVEVLEDDNDDGLLNPGEKVKIRVLLRNGGTSTLVGPSFVLSSDSAYVSVTSNDTGSCGNKLEPQAVWFCGSSTILVEANAPGAAEVSFEFSITDKQYNEWNLGFSLPIQ